LSCLISASCCALISLIISRISYTASSRASRLSLS